jgi:hypothetical protein
MGYRDASGPLECAKHHPVTVDALRAGPHALAVRSGPADGNELLYYGDLRFD